MIPVVDDFRSSAMTHRFGDLFNPPGLTNFLGCVQSDVDPVAIETARQLFAVLRDFDAAGVKLIWIEAPPDAPEWEGVRDRLRRAAAA